MHENVSHESSKLDKLRETHNGAPIAARPRLSSSPGAALGWRPRTALAFAQATELWHAVEERQIANLWTPKRLRCDTRPPGVDTDQ